MRMPWPERLTALRLSRPVRWARGRPFWPRLQRAPVRVLRAARGRLYWQDEGPVRAIEAGEAELDWHAAVGQVVESTGADRVAVTLEADVCRFGLLPWAPALTSPARWQTYAASRFEQLFGEPVDQWRLRVAEEMPPRARLLAAAPLGLLSALEDRFGSRLEQVRIGLLEQVGSLVQREPRFTGWAVQFTGREAWMLAFVGGALRRVRTRRLAWDEAADPLSLVAELGPVLRAEWAALRAGAAPALALMPKSVELAAGAALAAVGSGRLVALGVA